MCPMGHRHPGPPSCAPACRGNAAAQRVANFLNVSLEELKMFSPASPGMPTCMNFRWQTCAPSAGKSASIPTFPTPDPGRPGTPIHSAAAPTGPAMGKYDRNRGPGHGDRAPGGTPWPSATAVKMQQIALAWGVGQGGGRPPDHRGHQKRRIFDDAAGALSVKLRGEDIAYLEETVPPPPYRRRHRPQTRKRGSKLLDVKK